MSGKIIAGILILLLLLLNPAPMLTAVTPNVGLNNGTVEVTLDGKNFTKDTSVKLTHPGESDIQGTEVTFVSKTQLRCQFDLKGQKAGGWDVVVVKKKKVARLSNGFTIANPAPLVTAVEPQQAVIDSVCSISLTGAEFRPGATVLLNGKKMDIGATNVKVSSDTKISCDFDLKGAVPGLYAVKVVNDDGKSGSLNDGFLVENLGPTVLAIAPNHGVSGTTVAFSALTGKSFRPGATVSLSNQSASIQAENVKVISDTQLSGEFNLTGAAVGTYDVKVTNNDGKVGVLPEGFIVEYPAPTVETVQPRNGTQNKIIDNWVVQGTGFRPGATVALTSKDETINATDVQVKNGTQISGRLDLAHAAVGVYDVKVTNDDGKSAVLAAGFSVGNPKPTVDSANPGRGTRGAVVDKLILNGTGFRPGASVSLTGKDGTIAAADVQVVNGNQIAARLDLSDAAVGVYDVKVTNDDGKSGALAAGFSVENPAPTLASVQPGNGTRDTIVDNVTLSGTGFRPGATVRLIGLDTQIAASDVQVVNSKQVNCRLDLTGAAVGPYDLQVTNDDGKTAALNAGFTVEYPEPTIRAAQPQTGFQGALTDVTLEGSGFRPGAAVSFNAKDLKLQVSDVQVVNDHQINCQVNLSAAPIGVYDVQVANDDGKTGLLSAGFTVEYAAPVVTSVRPQTGLADTLVVSFEVNGSGFRPGATVELIQGQKTLPLLKPKIISQTRIIGIVDLKDAAPGAYDVRVTNSDGKNGVLSKGFSVKTVEPEIYGVTPDKGFNNGKILLTINGTNFDSGTTGKLVGNNGQTSLPGINLKLEGNSKLSGYFDIDHQPVGKYDVVVTDSRGHQAILKDGFTVQAFVPTASEINDRLKGIYFDFDKSNVRADQVNPLDQDVAILKANPQLYILLGGHADERGSQEYNLNLSRRRSETVQQYLVAHGIDPQRITIYAYGKEHPFKTGHDEEAWALNRRVDIVVGETPPTVEQGILFQGQQ